MIALAHLYSWLAIHFHLYLHLDHFLDTDLLLLKEPDLCFRDRVFTPSLVTS